LAGTGMAGFSDGDAAAARFYGPRGVVVSPDGKVVYVADYSNFRVRSISLEDGQVSTIMGGDEEGAAGAGGGGLYKLNAVDAHSLRKRLVTRPFMRLYSEKPVSSLCFLTWVNLHRYAEESTPTPRGRLG
jgi:hypothetical protein